MVVGWKQSWRVLAVAMLAVAPGGCSETLPLASLPSLTRTPDNAVLSKDEQEKAMKELIQKAHTLEAEAEAAKGIEKPK